MAPTAGQSRGDGGGRGGATPRPRTRSARTTRIPPPSPAAAQQQQQQQQQQQPTTTATARRRHSRRVPILSIFALVVVLVACPLFLLCATHAHGAQTTTTTTTTTAATTTAAQLGKTTTAATTAPPAPSDPLRRWLYDLVIPVPDISLPVPLIGKFNLTQLSCTDLLLGTISSSADNGTLRAGFNGLSIQCDGVYAVTLLKQKVSGPLKLMLTPASRIGVAIDIVWDDDSLPYAVVPTTLDVNLATRLKLKDAPDAINKLLNEIDKALTPTVNKEVEKTLRSLIANNLTAVVQQVAAGIRPMLNPPTHYPAPPAPPGADDLTHSPLIEVLSSFIDMGFYDNTINTLVDDLTNGTGTITAPLTNASVHVPLGNLGSITLAASEFAVGGLDSWSNQTIVLHPHDNTSLLSNIDLRTLDLNVSVSVVVNTSTSTQPLNESATIVFDLNNVDLIADMFLALDEVTLDGLPSSRVLNIDCLLAATSDVNVTQLLLDFTVDQLAILAGAGSTEQDIDLLLTNTIDVVVAAYDKAIGDVVNYVLMEVVRPDVNVAASAAINNATCPPVAKPSSLDASALAGYLASAGTSFIFILIGIALFAVGRKYAKRRRHQKRKQQQQQKQQQQAMNGNGVGAGNGNGAGVAGSRAARLSSRDSFATFADEQDEGEATALLASRIDRTSSAAPCLALEPTVSTFARYSVPLVLLATVAIFIWSNNSVGASVIPAITLGDDVIKFGPLFSFDLTNSVRDMWNAKVYALSLLIGAFSGSWPYLKLMLMLASWLLPTAWLSVSRREFLLRMLDALGKWSLIDSFVLVMMIVAFRFHLDISKLVDEPGLASFDIFVQPGRGIHTFLIATIVSLTMSHIILHIHRTAVDYHRHGGRHYDERDDDDGENQSLSRHTFTAQTGEMYRFTVLGAVLVVFALLASIVLLSVGTSIDAFTFEFKGLAALAMSLDGDDPNRTFSLITIGTTIPSSVEKPDSFGIRYIQALFFLLALAVPLVHLVALICIWFLPLSTHAQRHLFHAAEVLNAWSCLDVFVVSLLAAVLEIGQFAQFIIGDKCDPIDAIIKPHVKKWPRLRDDAKCFDVKTDLESGSWALFSAAVVSALTIWVVMPLCHRAVRERLYGPAAAHTRDQRLHTVNSMAALSEEPKKCAACTSCAPCMHAFEKMHVIKYDGVQA